MIVGILLWNAFFVSAQVWQPDLGNGYYQNPIIHADYSDPDIVRVGEDFYMTASSFNYSPGLPILHSKDLIDNFLTLPFRLLNTVMAFGLLRYGITKAFTIFSMATLTLEFI
jgi:hypothetical protein